MRFNKLVGGLVEHPQLMLEVILSEVLEVHFPGRILGGILGERIL